MASQTRLLDKKRKRPVETATEAFLTWQSTVSDSDVSRSSVCLAKQKNVKTFYDEFCVFPSLSTPPGNRYQVGRTALYSAVKREKTKLEPGQDVTVVRGRPPTLTPEEETIVIENCRHFEEIYGIITRFVVKTEARQMALRKRDDAERNSDAVWEHEALLRFIRVGGEAWMKSFLKRHPQVSVSRKKRPMEKARACKTQPEIALQHYRNIAHTYALCQIQKRLASGLRVEGWILSDGLVTREGGKGREPGHDILEVRENEEGENVFFVKPLGEPLQKLDPRLVIALDEKPLIPDCPTDNRMSTMGIRHMIGCSRSSTWTVTPVISASGHLLMTQLIFRGGSLGVETVKKVTKDIMVHRFDNGVQNDKSWVEFATEWMKKVPTSPSCPGVVFVDGHSSHLTRKFTKLAAEHHLYVICEPSNLSILLQTGDNGANAFIGSEYAKEYSTMFAIKNGAISVDDRVEAIWRVMKKITKKNDLLRHCFQAVRLTGDLMDCVGKWLPEQFAIGKQYRDERLPKVTGPFLSEVFSMEQLCQPWGTAVKLPQRVCHTIPPALSLSFQKWLSDGASEEQRWRLGDSAASYKLQRTEKTDEGLAVRLWGPDMEEWDTEALGKLKSKGRVYTGEGRCLYGDSANKEADEAETKAKEVETDRIQREKNRSAQSVTEAPMLDLFVSLGLIEKEKFPTKKTLEKFAILNPHLPWPSKITPSKSRQEQVTIILQLLTIVKSDTTFNC
jgi:hypothetical protein